MKSINFRSIERRRQYVIYHKVPFNATYQVGRNQLPLDRSMQSVRSVIKESVRNESKNWEIS